MKAGRTLGELAAEVERQAAIERTAGVSIARPVETVEVLQNRYGWNDTTRAGVLTELLNGKLGSTGWALSQAITRHSSDAADYDGATDLETQGGAIMELSPSDWSAIARSAEDLAAKRAARA